MLDMAEVAWCMQYDMFSLVPVCFQGCGSNSTHDLVDSWFHKQVEVEVGNANGVGVIRKELG